MRIDEIKAKRETELNKLNEIIKDCVTFKLDNINVTAKMSYEETAKMSYEEKSTRPVLKITYEDRNQNIEERIYMQGEMTAFYSYTGKEINNFKNRPKETPLGKFHEVYGSKIHASLSDEQKAIWKKYI